MVRRMRGYLNRWIWGCLLVLLTVGCAQRQPSERQLLSGRELDTMLQRAQDERRFWLTRYNTEQGPVFSGSFRVHTERFAVAEFIHDRYGTPSCGIEVRLRGPETYAALIDTSAGASWIEYELAQRSGVIPLGPTPVRRVPAHVDDTVPGILGVASRIVIDPVHVDTALLFVQAAHGPLKKFHRSTPRRYAPLVLGADFLRAFSFVQFHFTQREVLFATTTAYEPDPDRLVGVVPYHIRNGRMVMEGWIDNQPALFLLDSLGGYVLAAAADEERAAGPPNRSNVMLGELVWRQVPRRALSDLNLGLPQYARIGRELLDRFVVTIDGNNRRVVFERP